MASTYSPALRVELMGIGDQANTWGNTTNSNLLNVLEAAIAGRSAVVMGDTNITLTSLNNAPDQSRPRVLDLTSGVPLTAQRDVIVPSGAGVTKDWIVVNNTSGGQAVQVKTAAGLGVIVPNGQVRQVCCDGSDVRESITGALAWTVDGALAVGGSVTVAGNVSVTGTVSAAAFGGAGIDTVVPVGTLRPSASLSADPGWLLCDAAAYSRVTYAALFAKITRTLVAATTNGSAVITGTFDVSNLYAGMPVSGPGIQAGTTLTATISGSSITLSLAATATAGGVSVVVAPWGVGNGTTTFNVPDYRGRAFVGLDAMGGVAASRVTTAGSAFDGRRMGAVGGDQLLQAHAHGLNDPGHNHVVNDPTHAHAVFDPGHQHGYVDPGHAHGTAPFRTLGGATAFGGIGGNMGDASGTAAAGIGITISVSGTGIGIFGAGTGISLSASGTGASVASEGSGVTQNMPPGAACNIYIKF